MNCTIIIPTHNRHEKLERILKYLDKKEVNTIVVDSSESTFDAADYESVLYVHDSSFKFADKIIIACELAETAHVCLCADDDFVLVEKIESLLTEMPKSCSAIIGSTITFKERFTGEFRFQKKINESGFFRVENSENFFSDYSQVLWGVYSSSALKQAFSDIRSLGLKNDNFIELYLSHSLIQSGGIYRVKDFFSVREVSPSDHWGKRHKNLRLAYTEDVSTTLVDIANISALLGKDTFASDFAAYLGNVPRRRSFFGGVVRRILRKILDITGVNQSITVSQANYSDLSSVRVALSEVKSDQ